MSPTSSESAVPLPRLAVFRAAGADTTTFLHGQLAADVAALAPGESCFAAYCTPRGQVIGLMLVQRRNEDWLLAGDARLMETMIERLRRFVLRARITFEPARERLAGCPPGVDAAQAEAVLAPRGTDLRYAVVAPGPADAPPDRHREEWHWHELGRGVLWLQPETSERFVPQMLGLERIGAVSFNKGCYPGQEVIARSRYLGRVKRHPATIECSVEPAPSAGTNCTLHAAGESASATIVGVATRAGGHTRIVAVTDLPDEAPIDGADFGSGAVTAQRMPLRE